MQVEMLYNKDIREAFKVYSIFLFNRYVTLNKDNVHEYLYDLEKAVTLTETAFRNCDTPAIKDLYIESIRNYKREIDRVKNIIQNDELPNRDGTFDSNKDINGVEQ